MFEKGLQPQLRRFVVSQRLLTLLEVVDSARALELESVATQKSREMTSKLVALAEEKGKGKRSFASVGQGEPYLGGTGKQGGLSSCYNCRRLWHMVRGCNRSRGGYNRFGGTGIGQGHGQYQQGHQSMVHSRGLGRRLGGH